MQVLIAVVAVAAIAVVVGVVLVTRRRSGSPAAPAATTPTPAPPRRPIPDEPPPMNGLESALASVTDRTGHPIRERIDAETGHIDEFRVPDDTGPLLRRALDHVANPAAHPPGSGQAAAAPGTQDPTDRGSIDAGDDAPPTDVDHPSDS